MVIFDWNGTVVLDADRAATALNDVLTGRGIAPVPESEFSTTFRLPMAQMFTDLGIDDAGVTEAEAEWNTRMATTMTRLRSGVREALIQLADEDVWLGIVSAAAAEAVTHDLTSLDVPPVWDAVLAPAADKVTVLRALRHHADTAVYVGDTAYDMQCAIEAGYQPVGVRGGYSSDTVLERAGATMLINDLIELVSLVCRGADAH